MNRWTYLNWVLSHPFLFVWCFLWLALFEYAFTIDAYMLTSPYYFWGDYDIFETMMKIIFFEFIFFFFGMIKLLWFRKKCLKCSTPYIHEVNFTKEKWFKVFRKSNFFLFSDREFYADQKCSGCLFSILSIFWVVKFFKFLVDLYLILLFF